MTKLQAILMGLTAILASLVVLLAVKQLPEPVLSGAPPGLSSSLSTSSSVAVGTSSVVTLFAPAANTTAQSCTARVISTVGQPIMLSFGSTTPTATEGHMQTASTTVAYDSEIYGCGYIRAFGYAQNVTTPSSTISIMEFQ